MTVDWREVRRSWGCRRHSVSVGPFTCRCPNGVAAARCSRQARSV